MMCCVCCGLLALIFGFLVYFINRWYRRDFITDFNSKYVFITRTDSGFGHKLAIDLDKLGLHVYAGCYSKEGASSLKNKTSSNLKTILLDVTDQKSVDNAKTFIENDLPSGTNLWGIVNNAGIAGNLCSTLATIEDYRQVMEVNFFGSIRVTEAFEPLIIKSKGRIIQLISIYGRGCTGCAPYTCSKFASEPYADELRRNMKQFGVKVCSIEPSWFVQTSLLKNAEFHKTITKKFEQLPDWKKQHLGYDYVQKELNKTEVSWYSKLTKINKTLDVVTEAITHGLGAKHPKSRYLVGTGSRIYVLLAGYTPDWFLDYLLS